MELLAPAGNLEKLKVALSYGADAVYCGFQKFGLRAASDNFTLFELEEGIRLAHKLGKKVYLVLNGFLQDSDLVDLPEFLGNLMELKTDAVIVSDMGVLKSVKKNSSLTVHLSTQASVLNSESAFWWKRNGVKRIILGREIGLKEAGIIKRKTGLEIEMFIHGSLCMAYSGNCVISNYTSGRDSNRGGCAHSCRFNYSLEDEGNKKITTTFMSSKDLNGLELLCQFQKQEIDSIKIEGRMKSNIYVGTVSKIYKQALNVLKENGFIEKSQMVNFQEELSKFSHREYTTGSLAGAADSNSVFFDREEKSPLCQSVGSVLETGKGNFIVLQVKAKFSIGDILEILPFEGAAKSIEVKNLKTLDGEQIIQTRPGMLVKMDIQLTGLERGNIVRKKTNQSNILSHQVAESKI